MNTKIELDYWSELPVFESLIQNPSKILLLPKGWYEKFMDYMIQENMTENIPKLESLKHKISDKTYEEMHRITKYIEKDDFTKLVIEPSIKRDIIFEYLCWYQNEIGETNCISYVDEYLETLNK